MNACAAFCNREETGKEGGKRERGRKLDQKKKPQVNIGEIIKERPWKTPSTLKFLENEDLEIQAKVSQSIIKQFNSVPFI